MRETLQQLQKLFRLRNCDDTYFANRSRPCLQYQIQRCTAPCVGLISKENYARDVGAAIKVLEGRNDEVRHDLGRRMEAAAERLHFEEAAQLRDQLAKLKAVQAQQIVTADIDHDADVIAIAAGNGEYCVAVMFVRAGRSLGSTTFFPKAPFAELPEVLAAFVTQYYLERESPAEIIVEQEFDEMPLLEATLAQRSGHKVRIASQVRGIRARWLEMMHNNAVQALTCAAWRAPASSRASRICARPSISRRRRTASNASTSATRAAPTRWLPAWCSARRVRSRASIGASTSPGFSRATTMPRCIRR